MQNAGDAPRDHGEAERSFRAESIDERNVLAEVVLNGKDPTGSDPHRRDQRRDIVVLGYDHHPSLFKDKLEESEK